MAAKRSKKKLIIWVVVIVAILAGVGALMASKKREKPILITTEKAERRTITQVVTATGKIQPEIEVKISPEVSGEIIELPVREGQLVKRGDLLLRIKPDSYRAQVESQQAALEGARSASQQGRAELAKSKEDFERADDLFKKGLLSQSERNAAKTKLDISKAALDSSLSEIRRADGALRQINEALSKTVIYAPSDGTISSLTSRVGERVVGTSQFAGTEVMRIADLNNMEARVNVNENDVVNVKIGDTARINVDAYQDRTITGVVREIASTALTKNAGSQEEVTNFEVKIRISDRSLRLRPGMSATADIETDTVKDVMAVPIQSVTVRSTDSNLSPEEREKQTKKRAEQDKSDNRADVSNEAVDKRRERLEREKLQRVVFLREGETVKMQKVETGISDNSYIEIKSGLQPGVEVVSGSYTAISRRLKNGAKVEIEQEGGE
ncbi:MAG TPA: efflux RND transporter periplasmic adaptor subunit [Thermoanaerobaculia bacterium]|jgi:HlyD family secretion protein